MCSTGGCTWMWLFILTFPWWEIYICRNIPPPPPFGSWVAITWMHTKKYSYALRIFQNHHLIWKCTYSLFNCRMKNKWIALCSWCQSDSAEQMIHSAKINGVGTYITFWNQSLCGDGFLWFCWDVSGQHRLCWKEIGTGPLCIWNSLPEFRNTIYFGPQLPESFASQ